MFLQKSHQSWLVFEDFYFYLHPLSSCTVRTSVCGEHPFAVLPKMTKFSVIINILPECIQHLSELQCE